MRLAHVVKDSPGFHLGNLRPVAVRTHSTQMLGFQAQLERDDPELLQICTTRSPVFGIAHIGAGILNTGGGGTVARHVGCSGQLFQAVNQLIEPTGR